MERVSGPVQVLDEGDDPAVVVEVVGLAAALVHELDPDPGVEEGELPEALREGVEAVLRALEYHGVRLEANAGAGLVGLSHRVEIPGGNTSLEALLPDLAIDPDLHLQPL